LASLPNSLKMFSFFCVVKLMFFFLKPLYFMGCKFSKIFNKLPF
jgi:hypothetical protein